MRWLVLLWVAVAAGCTGAALGDRTIAVALGYDDDTNVGPESATGTVVIETASGLIDVSVNGLPTLEGDLYEAWLAGGGESATSIARFNTDGRGVGIASVTLGDLTTRTFERVMITLEPEPDDSPEPDVRHSIAGDIE